MNKRTIFASAVALLTTAGIAFAADQVNQPQQGDMPPPPTHNKKNSKHPEHNKDGLPRGFNKLNLTAAQKTKIKAIMEEGRPAKPTSQEEHRDDFRQKMAQRQAQEQQLLTNKTFDEQAAYQMIAERQQERAEMERNFADREVQMLKKRHAVFQVLTPTQQKQFLENQKQQRERFEKNHLKPEQAK